MKAANPKVKTKRCTTYFLVVTVILITCRGAQAQQIRYTTTNKTHELSPAKISLSVLNMESFLFPITVGGMAEGMIAEKFYYNVQYREGIIRNYMIPKNRLLSEQPESKGRYVELCGEFAFTDVIKPGKVKVITDRSFDGYYTSEKSFRAKCDVRRTWSLSGGLMEYSRPKYLGNDSTEYIISGNKSYIPTSDSYLHYNQNSFSVFAGITRRKIRKASVISDGRTRRVFYSKRFYMHALSGVTSVGDLTYKGDLLKIDNVKKETLGYRIGWLWDEMGVQTGFEFGKTPGSRLVTDYKDQSEFKFLSDNPFINYMKLSFHFNLWGGDKNYQGRAKPASGN